MNLGFYLLRAFQMGLDMDDLDCLEWGLVFDMMTEAGNDSCEYAQLATPEDIARL